MKKAFLASIILSFLVVLALPVYAADPASACPAGMHDNLDGNGCVTDTPASGSSNSNTFVPLTALPGIKDFVGITSVPALLSSIYKICIGLAATLAVLQIMLAGVEYMGGDSITEKKDARNRIAMAIVGLILVLSPTIVFSIINPKILNLDISSDVKQLAPNASGTTAPDNGASNKGFGFTHDVQTGDQRAQCTQNNGTATLICYNSSTQKQDPVGTNGSCPIAGDVLATDCQTAVSTNAPAGMCSNYEIDEYGPVPAGETCQSQYGGDNTGVVQIDTKCCDDSNTPEPGYVCCAHPTSAP